MQRLHNMHVAQWFIAIPVKAHVFSIFLGQLVQGEPSLPCDGRDASASANRRCIRSEVFCKVRLASSFPAEERALSQEQAHREGIPSLDIVWLEAKWRLQCWIRRSVRMLLAGTRGRMPTSPEGTARTSYFHSQTPVQTISQGTAG